MQIGMSTATGSSGPEAKYNMAFVWYIAIVAAMGGLLFGYDWVVIGGAKPFFERYFDLTNASQKGWANSCALIGCLVGALIAGVMSDKFGRKRLLIASAALFAITSIGNGLAPTFVIFVIWRMLGGVAIGLASNLSPMYIAEISPAAIRGKLVSINQLTIVIGILAAQLVNWLLVSGMPSDASEEFLRSSWYCQQGWRWMFGLTAVPALLFLVMMLFVPESPRWLIKRGKNDLAKKILGRIGGNEYADYELSDISKTMQGETGRVNFKELFEPKMVKILWLGIFLAVFQQWCGINVIFNYAEEIFKAAGYNVGDIMFNIVVTGLVMLVFTFVAIYTVDHLGRKILMLVGSAGLVMIYVLIGASYYTESKGFHVLFLVVSAIACYSFSLAPVTWVILSEIFPNRIRGAAMSIAVFALWAGCFTLTYTFPILNEKLGPAFTFWIYAAICAIGFTVVKLILPETKGKTLEQIERELVD